MKKLFLPIFCVFIQLVSSAIIYANTRITPPAWTTHFLVAHAGGGIDSFIGTNTLSAVEGNYALGHRVFEIDLNLTSDNVMVGIHDWSTWKSVPTWQEFSGKRISGQFSPTPLEQFVKFMSDHPDVYLVTDTKSFDYSNEQMLMQFQVIKYVTDVIDPSVRDRIIVQIYNQDMYYKINKIYKYPNIAYTLYSTPDTEEQVLAFAAREKIPVVVMPPERANQSFLNQLNILGIRVYLHTLNNKTDVRAWMSKGVWGVYTDTLLPQYFLY